MKTHLQPGGSLSGRAVTALRRGRQCHAQTGGLVPALPEKRLLVKHVIAAILVVAWSLFPARVVSGHEFVTSPDQPLLLEPGDRLVVLGDSISAMCRHTVLIDLYLAACRPDLNITFYQDAISGEDTQRFLRRFDGMLTRASPDLVICFYGINDAGWRDYSPVHRQRYEANTRQVLSRLKQADVRAVLASTSVMGPKLDIMELVNNALLDIQESARMIAEETDTPFVDVHSYRCSDK